MKFIPLHTKNTTIVYKNAICSTATVIVLVFIVLSVMVPVLLVSLLSPYSGIAESRILYEQPTLKFKHQYIFFGEIEKAILAEDESIGSTPIVCSTFANLNTRLQRFGLNCEGVKYWSEDSYYDARIDHAYFQLQLDSLPGRLLNFDLVLFFEAALEHKCKLSPPAMLAQRLTIPLSSPPMRHGRIIMKAELQLKQNVEFMCPFPGRSLQTNFRAVKLSHNDTDNLDLQAFRLEALLQQVKANAAYFQFNLQETYMHAGDPLHKLNIELQLHVLQVPARYHLSVWERLGQFWLYFASFFGISFYIMNKLKDFLFCRHIIRAWEVIPWKKLY